jgi:hypothetical protein
MYDRFSATPFLVRLGVRYIIHAAMSLTFLIVFMIVYWFFPGTLEQITNGLLQVEEPGPLELPQELIVAEAPAPMNWHADSRGGLILVTNATGDVWNPVPLVERMEAPWKERKPASQDAAGVVGGPSRDGRYVAEISAGTDYKGILTMREAVMDKVIARIHPFPATPNDKFIAWHPKMNILVAAGGGQITLVGGPDWRSRTLTTASRDVEEWKRKSALGEGETGYHPNEMVSQILFSADGTLLICAMDRGMRVYSWEKVLKAERDLPAPEYFVDGEIVDLAALARFRMTYTVAYDESRKWILWAGIEGTLCYLDTTTGTRGTLLRLSKGHQIPRMQFLDAGKLLGCEIVKMMSHGSEGEGLFLLDYGKLTNGRGERR